MESKTMNRTIKLTRRTEAQKREIIEFYLSTGLTKRKVWEKFTGQSEEHGLMLSWMREFGYSEKDKYEKLSLSDMIKEAKHDLHSEESEEVKELKKQLNEARIKAVAFSKMIDLAEQEFKIPIRKKYNSKP